MPLPYRGIGRTFEGSFPSGIKTDQTWMADRAVGDWFYRPGFVYDAGAVVRTLLEDVSRDGNLTLCVSLTPSGAMDEGSARMLKEVGQWMKINGEGIYGSRAWKIFAEGEMVKDPNRPDTPEKLRNMPGGKLNERHANFKFSTSDFRFTQGEDEVVYAWCMTVPKVGETLRIKNMGTGAGLLDRKIDKITLLGSSSPIKWKQEADALVITCPNEMPFMGAIGFKIN